MTPPSLRERIYAHHGHAPNVALMPKAYTPCAECEAMIESLVARPSGLRERIEALPRHSATMIAECLIPATRQTVYVRLDEVLALVSAEGEHPGTAPADWMERAKKLCEHHHPYVTLKPCDSCKAIASAHWKPDAARAASGGEAK